MFCIPSFSGFKIPSGGGFDADYQAILDYATTQGYTLPSASQQILQNQLMLDLKTAGVWSKLDTFAVFATDGNSDFALIDWVRLLDMTAVNSPTFGTDGGFQGNGTSSYIDTNFNPATQGVNYTLNDAGRFFWVDNRGGLIHEGPINTAFNNMTFNQNNNNQRINQGNASISGSANLAVDGFIAINRTSSTNVEMFTGTTKISRTATSTSILSEKQVVMRNGAFYASTRFRFYAMGASLVSENTDFYNALNTYYLSL